MKVSETVYALNLFDISRKEEYLAYSEKAWQETLNPDRYFIQISRVRVFRWM